MLQYYYRDKSKNKLPNKRLNSKLLIFIGNVDVDVIQKKTYYPYVMTV